VVNRNSNRGNGGASSYLLIASPMLYKRSLLKQAKQETEEELCYPGPCGKLPLEPRQRWWVIIPWFLLRRHLSPHVTHPVQEIADHAEEAEEITGVAESAFALFQVDLQVAPCVDDLHLVLLDVSSLLTTVRYNQLGSLFLYSLHLQHGTQLHLKTPCNMI